MKRFVLTVALCLVSSPFAFAQSVASSPEIEQGAAKPAEVVRAADKVTDVKATEVKSTDAKPADTKSAEVITADIVVVKEKAPSRQRLPHIGSMKSENIPGQPWRIHDALRPRPVVVTPGASDSQPPSDAIVLFDGTDLSNWCHRGPEDELYEAEWKIVDGCLEVAPRTGNLYTIDSFGSCQLHIEWFIPEGTTGTSQGRGNSGIKIMERFEIQVLDSYRNRTYADGQAGSIYGQYPPLVNAVRRPGEWQTYEIFFEAPIFEDDKLKRPATVTLLHNGVLVQLHRELAGPTGARLPKYTTLQPAAPIMLQDHGNKVRYRNIWIRPVAQ